MQPTKRGELPHAAIGCATDWYSHEGVHLVDIEIEIEFHETQSQYQYQIVVHPYGSFAFAIARCCCGILIPNLCLTSALNCFSLNPLRLLLQALISSHVFCNSWSAALSSSIFVHDDSRSLLLKHAYVHPSSASKTTDVTIQRCQHQLL